MAVTACKICGNTDSNVIYLVKEMQLGLREEFEYMECGDCGCMQLLSVPADLVKYYPNEEYYSVNFQMRFPKKPDYMRKLKAAYLLYGRQALFGSLFSIGYKIPEYYEWMKIPQVQWTDAILDVGCGNGALLTHLFKIGFTNLTGIDPFINAEQHIGNVNVFKKDIYEIEGSFDYIMLHHSFEHMDEPLRVLLRLKELLNNGKYMLIRIPLMGMHGWNTYRENWVGLDAPRHLFIHTLKSMELLAKEAGLEIRKIVFDSGPYHFWASEQYKNDIPLMAPNSHMVNEHASSFSKEQIKAFRELADQTNKEGKGDQAAFYLYKP